MTASNLLTEWARLLLETLHAAGVRDAVVSPGARSTPFAWAALHTPGIRCHSIIDERSAAFFALGHARITDTPVLLLCTSGSAAANYFPAVVEASEAAVPMVLLTADRGLDLQHAAAPQTVDQTRLYGRFVREFFELGTPDPHPRMLRALQRFAAQAVLAARSPVPGPVHLNARARKPLEPIPAAGDDADGVRSMVDALVDRGPALAHGPSPGPSAEAIEVMASAIHGASRGLIVCGPALPRDAARAGAVAALARATGFPVVAEPTSQQRFAREMDASFWIDSFATLIGTSVFRDSAEPEVILQLGRPPTETSWGAYLDRWPGAERYVVAPSGWPDPWSAATAIVRGPISPTIDALVERLAGGGESGSPPQLDARARERSAWLETLRVANAAAWRVTDATLAQGFSEGAAVRAAVEATPRDGVLALGNSLPIREVEMFVPASTRPLTVWAQRGANGIDGLVSGAAGAATAADRPTTLILGDVSFAHDIGGLAAARDVRVPFVVVVLNNGGGRIFERLPIADRIGADRFAAWLTPPSLDLAAAAATYGLRYARAADAGSLDAAFGRAAAGGTTILEVVIPEDGTTAHQRGLLARLESELRG